MTPRRALPTCLVVSLTLLCGARTAAATPTWGEDGVAGYATADVAAGYPLWDEGDVVAGASARAYAVLLEAIHVGGFAGWWGAWADEGHVARVDALLVGASGRFGGAVSDRLWLGFGLDAGVALVPSLETRDGADVAWDEVSAWVEPSVVLIGLWPVGAVHLGLEARLGAGLLLGHEEGRHLDQSWGGPAGGLDVRAAAGLSVGWGG